MGTLAIEFSSEEEANAFLDEHRDFQCAPFGRLVEALYPAKGPEGRVVDEDTDENMR